MCHYLEQYPDHINFYVVHVWSRNFQWKLCFLKYVVCRVGTFVSLGREGALLENDHTLILEYKQKSVEMREIYGVKLS